jgi:hypothetical protein
VLPNKNRRLGGFAFEKGGALRTWGGVQTGGDIVSGEAARGMDVGELARGGTDGEA